MFKKFLLNGCKGLIVISLVLLVVCSVFFIYPMFEGSCDLYTSQVSQTYPEIPKDAFDVEVIEMQLVDRYADSYSRSSTVNYKLILADKEGHRKEAIVSKDEFLNAKDGVTYYDYRYSIRPYTTYIERMHECVRQTWGLILGICTIPFLGAVMQVIASAVDAWKDSHPITNDSFEYWKH